VEAAALAAAVEAAVVAAAVGDEPITLLSSPSPATQPATGVRYEVRI
jgi:hypothetical protein